MSQPVWKITYATDCERLLVDETGVHAPVLEHADELEGYEPEDSDVSVTDEEDADPPVYFQVYCVEVERLHRSPVQLALAEARLAWQTSPKLVDVVDANGFEHQPWFEDDDHAPPPSATGHCLVEDYSAFCKVCRTWIMRNLTDAARAAEIEVETLREQFCSTDPNVRASAYYTVASYHGWDNFDNYPLTLTKPELDERWSTP